MKNLARASKAAERDAPATRDDRNLPTCSRRRPALQTVRDREPEIEWTPVERIEPGVYPAFARSARMYRDPQFHRWVLRVNFDILDSTLTRTVARLAWFPNLGEGPKPRAGRRSQYLAAWIDANGGQPNRRDRISPRIFLNRHARVLVEYTKLDHLQRPVASDKAYSVVRSVLRWETGLPQ